MRRLTSIFVVGVFTIALSPAALSHSTGHSGGQGGTTHGGVGPSSHSSSVKTKGSGQGCYGTNHKCGRGPHMHGGPKGTSFPHQH
jgi:hypothetical protein